MAKFIGSSKNVAVDSKGRITIPSSMRKALPPDANHAITITRGLDRCLAGYALDDWDKRLEELQQFSQSDPQMRKVVRVIASKAFSAELDKQGRIHVPRELLDLANIQDRVTIIGAVHQIEFWNPDRYEAYMKDADEIYDQVAERLRV